MLAHSSNNVNPAVSELTDSESFPAIAKTHQTLCKLAILAECVRLDRVKEFMDGAAFEPSEIDFIHLALGAEINWRLKAYAPDGTSRSRQDNLEYLAKFGFNEAEASEILIAHSRDYATRTVAHWETLYKAFDRLHAGRASDSRSLDLEYLDVLIKESDERRTQTGLDRARYKIALQTGLLTEERLEDLYFNKNFSPEEIRIIDRFTLHHLNRRVAWEDFTADRQQQQGYLSFIQIEENATPVTVLPPIAAADIDSQKFVAENVKDFLSFARDHFGNLESVSNEQSSAIFRTLSVLSFHNPDGLQLDLPLTRETLQAVEKSGKLSEEQIFIANQWFSETFEGQRFEYSLVSVIANQAALAKFEEDDEIICF